MITMPQSLALLSLLPLLLLLPMGSAQVPSRMENATATFYGGLNGVGAAEQAACGYGNLSKTSIGMMNAAASLAMWADGSICGACFEVSCRESKWCRWGSKVIVTITNLCPRGSEGGWCDPPRRHLDMAFPAWSKIATDPVAGVVRSFMRRVACPRQGGISLRLSGNPWWTSITVLNVAGSGDLAAVDVSTDKGSTWQPVSRNWGAVWSVSGKLLGKALSFRFRAGLSNQVLTVVDGVASTWQLGKEYDLGKNFPTTTPLSPPPPSPPPPSLQVRRAPVLSSGKKQPPPSRSPPKGNKSPPKLKIVKRKHHKGLHS